MIAVPGIAARAKLSVAGEGCSLVATCAAHAGPLLNLYGPWWATHDEFVGGVEVDYA